MKFFSLRQFAVVFSITITAILFACTKDSDKIDTKDYPVEIGKIFRGRCATSGCHNDVSYKAAAGLDLSSWQSLFRGSNNGSPVIPYRSDYSSLCYFINTYPDLGLVNLPTMPVNNDPLDREEVKKIKEWINSGAPNASGQVAFADNSARKKFYVAHTACGIIMVFDVASRLPMRCITVVNQGETCSPHSVKVAPDGKYWYVCYNVNGKYLRRYNASDDSFAGEVFIGAAEWNSFVITPDSKKAFVVDWSSGGKLATVDLENMQLLNISQFPYLPHGSAVSPNGQFLYFTSTTGNFIYKREIANGNMDQIPLNGTDIPGPSNLYNAHEILFNEDGTKYFVTCQDEHAVRIFDAATDNCIAVIPIAGSALEMSLSPSRHLLFVSSWDAPLYGTNKGAVAVINTQTNALHSTPYINVGSEPHGLAVDDQNGLLYVANRNIDVSGPIPHHTSVCSGRNGYVVFVDLNTFSLTGKRIEVGVDPYSVALRE